MLGAYRRLIDCISAGNGRAMLCYGIVHALAVALGTLISDPGGTYSGLWPAVGVQAAFLVIAPTSRWIAMLAAAVLVEGLLSNARFWSTYATATEMLLEFPYAAINAMTATLLATAYRRVCGSPLPDARVSMLMLLAILGVLLLGAIIGSAWLRWTDGTAFLPGIWNWYITDLLGVFAAGVPLLIWWFRARGNRGESPGSGLELAASSVVAIFVSELMFTSDRFAPDFHLPYLLFPIMLWVAARFHPRVVATLAGVLTMYITFLANHVSNAGTTAHRIALEAVVGGTTMSPDALLPLQLFLGMLMITSLMLSIALNERRALNRRLREVSRLVAAEQQRARQRFAIDLRNGIDGALSTIEETLQDSCNLPADRQTSEVLLECRQLVGDMRHSVRSLADDLTPESIGMHGLVPALDRLLDRMRSGHAIDVSRDLHGALDAVTPARAAMLLRVVQELLLNVAKHAGVKSASVAVRERRLDYEIEVRDSGRGFDPQRIEQPDAGGFGLSSIRDQVEDEGGSFDISSTPGEGCIARVRLPKDDAATG